MSVVIPQSVSDQVLGGDSCGLVARATDSIERLGFIAIRYRALIGEALSSSLIQGVQPSRQRLQTLNGTFDVIEHLAQDFVDSSEDDQARTRGLASCLMDSAIGMTRMLEAYALELGDLLVPTLSDLRQLYLICQSLGGRPRMFDAKAASLFEQSQVIR